MKAITIYIINRLIEKVFTGGTSSRLQPILGWFVTQNTTDYYVADGMFKYCYRIIQFCAKEISMMMKDFVNYV